MKLDSETSELCGLRLTGDGTAYSVYGAGAPVVLVHGVGMSREVWQPQVRCLAQTHTVIVYDMLGHGASLDPKPEVTLADYADQLVRLLDHLELDQVSVVGHSMGALVALEFALRQGRRARKVAAINGVFMRTEAQSAAVQERLSALKSIGIESTINSTIARWFGDPMPADMEPSASLVSNLLQQVHPKGYPISYGVFAHSDAAHADRLVQLKVPALFMTGECDPNSTPAMSKAMARRAPLGTYEILAGARHMMTLTSADQVNRCLQEFLIERS